MPLKELILAIRGGDVDLACRSLISLLANGGLLRSSTAPDDSSSCTTIVGSVGSLAAAAEVFGREGRLSLVGSDGAMPLSRLTSLERRDAASTGRGVGDVRGLEKERSDLLSGGVVEEAAVLVVLGLARLGVRPFRASS